MIVFKQHKYIYLCLLGFLAVVIGILGLKTAADLVPLPSSLTFEASELRKVQVFDRHQVPLTVTYQNQWNLHAYTPLHRIPLLLQQAFVTAEDQRFYRHHGVDWIARLHAVFQNLKAGRAVRGASTISEQVVRMLHQRPRTLWSRWLEGWEAAELEQIFSKADILEFYLNQIPFASRRRGVLQAAHYFFDRDLDTLNPGEVLALAVMVRAPGRLDLHRAAGRIKRPLRDLAARMLTLGQIDGGDYRNILEQGFQLRGPTPPVDASHFIKFLFAQVPVTHLHGLGSLQTTLDAGLQAEVQKILDGALETLEPRRVQNGAVLVVDHQRHEVLAWVNGGHRSPEAPGSWIDAVLAPRQPGSTMKPFLYGLALEKGWTAATLIDDGPLAAAVGGGLHPYHNYSRTFHGRVRLRTALGNSLNTPALRTIRYVGTDHFLDRLKVLGFDSLQNHPDHYGDGLALGNGEVTLFELVRAYAALANRGELFPLQLLVSESVGDRFSPRRAYSEEIASLISDILSDPDARRLEFGHGGLLRLPIQTAVKTGTSNDYRDAWALGYNYRYTVGVWLGNLDGGATDGVSGASGPALVLRSIFSELTRHERTHPLHLSPSLIQLNICAGAGQGTDPDCPLISEWFIAGTAPEIHINALTKPSSPAIEMLQPTNGLQLAMDPRIPDDHEAFRFALNTVPPASEVVWYVDDEPVAKTSAAEYLWPLKRGRHQVRAGIRHADQAGTKELPPVNLYVK